VRYVAGFSRGGGFLGASSRRVLAGVASATTRRSARSRFVVCMRMGVGMGGFGHISIPAYLFEAINPAEPESIPVYCSVKEERETLQADPWWRW
jgi:hypothetical protein